MQEAAHVLAHRTERMLLALGVAVQSHLGAQGTTNMGVWQKREAQRVLRLELGKARGWGSGAALR